MYVNVLLLMIYISTDRSLVGGTVRDIKRRVENGLYNEIIDFDDHFDTISKDWTNPAFNKAIEQ